MTAREYTLNEVAERLGVHYMTAYRYVRTGRLWAHQRGAQWHVDEGDLELFEKSLSVKNEATPSSTRRTPRPSIDRLVARLMAGDEPGCWTIVQEFQSGGATAKGVYLDLFVPAMRTIGERWSLGQITVAAEHRASAVMHRLIGRMGPQFRPRGPRRGSVIVGAPSGELHGLPIALAADLLRSTGFTVVDLGADVPGDAFAACAHDLDDLVAVAISVTASQHRTSTARVIEALRRSHVKAPIFIGGAGVGERDAVRVGADRWVPDVESLVEVLRAR